MTVDGRGTRIVLVVVVVVPPIDIPPEPGVAVFPITPAPAAEKEEEDDEEEITLFGVVDVVAPGLGSSRSSLLLSFNKKSTRMRAAERDVLLPPRSVASERFDECLNCMAAALRRSIKLGLEASWYGKMKCRKADKRVLK